MKAFAFKRKKILKQRMRGFVEGKSFKVNCSTDGPKVVPL